MKNHASKIVTFLLLTAIAFLVYPATYYYAGQNPGTVQNVIVDDEADGSVSFYDYTLL
ncbi:MAG: hypothetical protein J5623_04455 [Clostridiales bacterium]|nr:hypothetical protein [Clostridiales bacterium]